MMEEKLYWLGLSYLNGVGPVTIKSLYDYFKSAKNIWQANKLEIKQIINNSRISSIFIKERMKLDILSLEKKLQKKSVNYIAFSEKGYPAQLCHIYDPPPVLFYQGVLDFNSLAIAIVGTRKSTIYGREIADKLASELAGKGINIVSGLARGIDTAAHQGALNSNGFTTAVTGAGFDYIYPPENKNLFEDIAEHGLLITEFPPEIVPRPYNFPRRNRIISGLTQGVIVVEAAEKSGALITANFALEQGREVFAVPGNINRQTSKGTNNLIKEGAIPVLSSDDVLSELLLADESKLCQEKKTEINYSRLTEKERKILKIFQHELELNKEDLLAISGYKTGKINEIIVKLELKGLIERENGKKYVFKGLQNLLKPI